MHCTEVYARIAAAHQQRLRNGETEVDEALNNLAADRRRGISLVIPIHEIEAYPALIDELTALERSPYAYPPEDLHLTVFDFIHCKNEYRPDPAQDAACIAITEEALAGEKAFPLRLEGVLFTTAALIFKGDDGGRANGIRERLRRGMTKHGLPNDERYPAQSAHVSFLRFRQKLPPDSPFFKAVERHENTDFGSVTANRLELVEHDWYNRQAVKRLIKSFAI